jgi:tetratricopeptide (TPR) repeat protein
LKVFRWVTLLLLCAIPGFATPDPEPYVLVKTGRADAAIRALNSTLVQSPNNARAYNLLCRVYFQLEFWDDAVRLCEKAVALDPQSSSYHQWLGRAMGRKAEVANPVTAFNLARRVKSEFERAVALDGNNLSARSDLSEYYIEAPSILGGDKGKARQQAAAVAKINPALGTVMLAHVEEKQATGRAEAEYKKAVSESNSPSRCWVELAHFYRRAKRLNEMEQAANQSLATAHEGDGTEFDVAELLLHGGRNFNGAIEALRRYIAQQDPSEDGPVFQAYYVMGTLLEKQGRRKEAVAAFRSSLELASQYKPARDALSRVSR